MIRSLPNWLMQRYSKLWFEFKNEEFDYVKAKKTLKEENDKRLLVIISDLKKGGWLDVVKNPEDRRRSIYKLKPPEKAVEEIAKVPFLNKTPQEKKERKHHPAWELGESKDPKAINKLIEYLKSDKYEDRRVAASALGKLSKFKSEVGKATPYLINLLKDENPQIRQYAAKSLAKIRDPKAITELKHLLKDEKDYVRGAARKAIDSITKKEM